MIEKRILPPFSVSDRSLRFVGASAYTSDNNAYVVFEKSGHMIMLPRFAVDCLAEQRLPVEYERKLISRGFLFDPVQERPIFPESCECINTAIPEFVMVDMTSRCNMQCKYCLRKIESEGEFISDDILRTVCDFITVYCNTHKLHDLSIQAWGGEPLLRLDKLLQMKDLIRPDKTKVHYSIETNALLLSESVLKELYNNRIGIGISIDGTSRLHDSQRITPSGNGTHSIVEQNLRSAMALYGKRIGTITTLTKNNAPYVDEILEYFAVDLGLENVKFNFVHRSMFTACDELCLSADEIAEASIRILNKLVDLLERGYRIFESNLRVKLNNILYRKYTDICHSCGCCGGRKMITIGMDGQIYPCELTDSPEEAIGSVFDPRDLAQQISESTPSNSFFLKKSVPECTDCDWYVFCRGGCTVRTISSGKRPPSIDVIECAVNKAVYPALIHLILNKPELLPIILKD